MGERFGSYEILRRIAVGGMAEVFLAKQKGLGGFERLVCIKRILPHLGIQEDFIKMFQDEARIVANLAHPNIAQIYEIGRVDGAYYIAMEYVRGEDLRQIYNQEVTRRRTIPAVVAAHIALGAAMGLDQAHRQTALDGRPLGIVHRDVSPQNILVTYDGYVKLVDFGVAKAIGKMAETRTGVLKGKYAYMSPEQAAGDPVDGRTDVFALGIALYEVTTGSRLFKRSTEIDTLHAVIACEVRPPSNVSPGYDPDLEVIVRRALARNPDERYQTAGEMGQRLEAFLQTRGSPPSAATLATYLRDLFADKLAGELLLEAAEKEPSSSAGDDWLPTSAAQPDEHDRMPTRVVALRVAPAASHEKQADHPDPVPGRARARHDRLSALPRIGWLIAASVALLAAAAGLGAALLLVPKAPVRTIPALEPSPTAVTTGGDRLPAVTGTAADTKIAAATTASPADERTSQGTSQGSLSVTAPLSLRLRLDGRFIGETPLRRLAVDPGEHVLELESDTEGFLLRQQVRVAAGKATSLDVRPGKGHLWVDAVPWAWVRLGQRAPLETPVRLEVYAGSYEIVLDCENGRRTIERARVEPGETTHVRVSCRE